MHRIAISDTYRCQPWEILERWSWMEVWEAHRVLDYLEELRDRQADEKPGTVKSNLPRKKRPKAAKPV